MGVMEGWIKLHNKFLKWEWITDSKMVHLFIHLLLKANYEDKKWQGQMIKRGQLIAGRKALSRDTGISERSIRTCLEKLKSTNELTIEATSKYSVITICNYEKYQHKPTKQTTKNMTSKRPANDQQTTTPKDNTEVKNIQTIDNSIDIRKLQFIQDCTIVNTSKKIIPGADLVAPIGHPRQSFTEYWTEHGAKDKKMKFEKLSSFSISLRLHTWKRNLNKFNNSNQQHGHSRRDGFAESHKTLQQRIDDNS